MLENKRQYCLFKCIEVVLQVKTQELGLHLSSDGICLILVWLHNANIHWNSLFLHAIEQRQLALSQDMKNTLTWNHCVVNIEYENVPSVNLFPSIVEEAPPNEKISILILLKKDSMNIKNFKSNMLIKRKNMFNARSNYTVPLPKNRYLLKWGTS